MICLYGSTVVPDTEKEQEWTPVTGPLLALKEEDQLLVRRLSRHILNGEGNSVWSLGEAPEQTFLRGGWSSGPCVPGGFLSLPLFLQGPLWTLRSGI